MSDKDDMPPTWAVVLGVIAAPLLIVWHLIEGIFNLVYALRFTPARQERDAKLLNESVYNDAVEMLGPDKRAYADLIFDKIDDLPEEVADELLAIALEIWDDEGYVVGRPPPVANSIEGARYRDQLSKRPDPLKAGRIMAECFRDVHMLLPRPENGILFPMKLRDIASPEMVHSLVLPLYKEDSLFRETKKQLDRQLHRLSNVPFTPEHMYSDKLVLPTKYKGPEHITKYVYGTPLDAIFNLETTFTIPIERLFEHTHIVGGSGSGKTQLIQSLYLELIKDDNSIVVVDSQTDLIRNIAHMAGRDPIIISPKDLPSFNIFDVPTRSNDPHTKEQIANGVIETYMYVFDGIIGADLTAKQGVFFKMVARLLLNLKETMGRPATIMDMFRLMDDMTPYLPAINALSEIPRTFFLKDFQQATFKQTREQIRYRLNAILENPTIAKLFTAEHNSLDFYKLLQEGNIILIDTAGDFLKESSPHFGRFFISLILRAIYERAASTSRHPTFLIIDEASQYFDSNIDDMLSSIRKYRCGAILAHQFLDQATPQLRASFAANTSVRFVSGVSSGDSRNLAPDMRTTPDFILAQPKLSFACHVRGMKNAVSLRVEAGKMENLPHRDDYRAMLERNRARVTPRLLPKPEAAREAKPVPPVLDDDPLAPVDNW